MRPVTLIVWAMSAFFAKGAEAQTHAAILTWQDALNPSGTTYNIYRKSGICPAPPAFFPVLVTGVATLTYTDSTVNTGDYCYEVTAVYANQQSSPSNLASAVVPAFSPTGLSVLTSDATPNSCSRPTDLTVFSNHTGGTYTSVSIGE